MDQERKIEFKLDGFVGIFENVFEDDFIEQRQNLIAEQLGIRITTHKMELYGHCIEQNACIQRQKSKGI